MNNLRIKNSKILWPLFFITPVLLGITIYSRNYLNLQFKVLIFAALIYLIFTTLYHLKDKTLTFEIIIEYMLIAALALVMF